MNEQSEKELKMLIEKRWDPRREYGKRLGLVICWLWEREMKAKITKRVKATEGFLCPWCQYPFTGLDEEGKCPECGAGYRKELCEELYQNVFRSFQPDPHELAKRESKAWREAIELRDGSSSL